MYISYSQKCVFSRNHTIKKKKRQKKGVESGFPQLFNPKTHKSHQSHQVNPTSSRRGPRARPRSPRPNPRPLHRSQRNQRRGSKKQTGFESQKGRKFPEFGKKELFLEIFLIFGVFEDVIFPCFSKPLIVFGYGCIWLFSFQLLVVWSCFVHFCSPTPPTWPPSSLAIWPPSSLGWKPAVINDPFGWRRTEVNNGE